MTGARLGGASTAGVRAVGAYDVERVRADFPILSTRVNGHPLVYLDNAASAQKPRQVVERMTQATYAGYANVHRGAHHLSALATDAYEAARERVRLFLNAGSADEIVFTKSATEAINLVASSFGEASIRPGDEIVLSVMEHHANIVPWHLLRERRGAVLRWIDVEPGGGFPLEALEAAITPRTRIVAVTHMSNVLGFQTPLREIVRIAHARGVPVLADGAQAAVHGPVDVRALDVDFYAITGHKLYGPTGIGALYGRAGMLARLPPFLGGGDMVDRVTREAVTYAAPPHRFEAGTPPIIEAIGLAAALDYIEGVGRDDIRAHEAALGRYARRRLGAIGAVRLAPAQDPSAPIVAFNVEGAHAHDVALVLDRFGVAVRAGQHCAQPLLDRLGATSICRASIGAYNTAREVDDLGAAVEQAISHLC